MKNFPFHKQETSYTCGAASLRMALEKSGISLSEKKVAKLLKTNKVRGSWTKNFPFVAECFSLNYIVCRNSSVEDLKQAQNKGYAIIVLYLYPPEKVDHYSIIRKFDKNYIYFWDPWFGPDHKYTNAYFRKIWSSDPKYEDQKKWFIGIKK
jgi:predicted double-glycine peptidase